MTGNHWPKLDLKDHKPLEDEDDPFRELTEIIGLDSLGIEPLVQEPKQDIEEQPEPGIEDQAISAPDNSVAAPVQDAHNFESADPVEQPIESQMEGAAPTTAEPNSYEVVVEDNLAALNSVFSAISSPVHSNTQAPEVTLEPIPAEEVAEVEIDELSLAELELPVEVEEKAVSSSTTTLREAESPSIEEEAEAFETTELHTEVASTPFAEADSVEFATDLDLTISEEVNLSEPSIVEPAVPVIDLDFLRAPQDARTEDTEPAEEAAADADLLFDDLEQELTMSLSDFETEPAISLAEPSEISQIEIPEDISDLDQLAKLSIEAKQITETISPNVVEETIPEENQSAETKAEVPPVFVEQAVDNASELDEASALPLKGTSFESTTDSVVETFEDAAAHDDAPDDSGNTVIDITLEAKEDVLPSVIPPKLDIVDIEPAHLASPSHDFVSPMAIQVPDNEALPAEESIDDQFATALEQIESARLALEEELEHSHQNQSEDSIALTDSNPADGAIIERLEQASQLREQANDGDDLLSERARQEFENELALALAPDDLDLEAPQLNKPLMNEDQLAPVLAVEHNKASGRQRVGLWSIAAVLGVLGLGAAGVYFLSGNPSTIATSSEPVIIQADAEPVKVEPDEPGGTTPANQDKTVYDNVTGVNIEKPEQETLVTSTQEPIDLPGVDPDLIATVAGKEEVRLIEEAARKVSTALKDADVDGEEFVSINAKRVKTLVLKQDGTLAPRPENTAALVEKSDADLRPSQVSSGDTETASNEAEKTVIDPDVTASTTEIDPPARSFADESSSETPTITGAVNDAAETAVEGQTKTSEEVLAATQETVKPLSEVKKEAEESVAAPVRVVQTSVVTAPQKPGGNVVFTTPARVPAAPSRPADQPLTIVNRPATQTPQPQQVASVEPTRPAVTATSNPGGYYIQISSQPSRAAAQRSYQSLNRRFGGLIGGRGVDIQRANIAGKGVYHRVRIPAGSRAQAANLCARYKSAGGSCFVAR